MSTKQVIVVALLGLLGLGPPAHAISYTWVGTTSTAWATNTNWSPLGIPGVADSVTIGTNATVTISSNYTVASLTMKSGSTLTGAGSVTVNTSMTANDVTLDGSGSLSVAAGAQASFGRLQLGNKIKRKLINSGVVTITDGDIIFNTDVSNNAGATFNVQSDGLLAYNASTAPVFRNAGAFVKSIGSGTTAVTMGFVNTGQISVQSGTLDVGTGFSQSAGSTSLDGGNLSSSAPIQISGGSLQGSGIINGNVINNANLHPGHSPGSITINGNYTQTANSTLDMEIAGLTPGAQYDQLIVLGTATLDGTLNIVQYDGFVPQDGTNFQLINFYSIAGGFARTNLQWPSAQCYFTTVSTSTYYVATSHRDVTPPAVTIEAPVANGGYATFTTATGTASDDSGSLGSGVTLVLYRYATSKKAAGYWAGGTSWNSSYSVSNERPVSGTTTWNLILPTLTVGQYYVRAKAKDAVGNTTVTPNQIFWIDNVAPTTLTFTTPAAGSYTAGFSSIKGTAADNSGGSGIAQVSLLMKRTADGAYWSGSAWAFNPVSLATSLSGTTWSSSTILPSGSAVSGGGYMLTATAYDRSGYS